MIRPGLNNTEKSSESLMPEKLVENIKKMNISENGFFIQKADIKIKTQDGSERFIGNIRYGKQGKYLISLRTKTGIEAARIMISEDTLLINDRFNKKFYYGSSNYIMNKYGISSTVFPLIFGDFISDRFVDNKDITTGDRLINIYCLVKGIKIGYLIDSKRLKIIRAVTESSLADENMEINYKNFLRKGDFTIPGIILIKNSKRKWFIEVRIKKIEVPWNEQVEFIPGNRYEHIELL